LGARAVRGDSGKEMKGYFIGDVVVLWLKDGRKMKMMEDFTFVDSKGRKWTTPKGFVINGADLPWWTWGIRGRSPFVGKPRRATLPHDFECEVRRRGHRAVHRMFLEAMLCDGTPKEVAEEWYWAVSKFGPKWNVRTGKRLKEIAGRK